MQFSILVSANAKDLQHCTSLASLLIPSFCVERVLRPHADEYLQVSLFRACILYHFSFGLLRSVICHSKGLTSNILEVLSPFSFRDVAILRYKAALQQQQKCTIGETDIKQKTN